LRRDRRRCTAADADGSACDDGQFCNGTDTCTSGACSAHAGDPCLPLNTTDSNCSASCDETADSCSAADPDTTACVDGLFCNGTDTCTGGTCSTHSGDPCLPLNTTDSNCSASCDETADSCSAADPDTTACVDGLFCNGTDTCTGGACTTHAGDPCLPLNTTDSNCSASCDETADSCSAADPDTTACVDGLFCNGTDTCTAGTCSTHTGDPCPGPDADNDCAESCDESADNCAANDPNGAACNDGAFCNGTDTCAAGNCSTHTGDPCPGPDGDNDCAESCNEVADDCAAPDSDGSTCDDGVFCNGNDFCSGGTCSTHTGDPCSGPDGDANCSESCNETADDCSAPDTDGSACTDGLFCTGTDTCSSGTCSAHTGDPCPGADGDGDCSESCNEGGDNCTAADTNGSACTDGLFCTGTDTCQAGNCSVHTGDPCPGADGDGDCSESCNEAGDDCTAADTNGSACDDGLFCTGTDTCSAGACSTHTGDPCPGADGDADCSESCNEAGDDCTAADTNGAACDDGAFCNGTDTCTGGTCSTHTGDPCLPLNTGDADCSSSCNEGGNNCLADDPDGTACDDAAFCNGTDTCNNGNCSVHTGDPCLPLNTTDSNCATSCDESGDSCSADDPNGTACDDALFCNGADTCTSGTCSAHAGDPCLPLNTTDSNCATSCDESGDSCSADDPNGTVCDDALFCNGTDTCTSGTCSAHTGDPCLPLDTGNANCAESCDEAGDNCSADDPNGTACDDGLFCTGTDSCTGGTCSSHTGDPCPGPDGDGDCAESCKESADDCTANDVNGSACEDGLFCNGTDTCAAGNCSTHTGDPCPGADGDGNCSESCSEPTDDCTAPDSDGASCDDGLFCNGADSCNGGTCSDHTGDPCSGPDGDANCSETCDETVDNCGAPDPDGTSCTDGLFCTGTDTCSGGTCSSHTGDPCPGADGDGDCSESCNEAGDNCNASDANGSACTDGLFCTGTDTCNGGTCSDHTGDPCPGADGDGDCSESCNETADDCTAADTNGSACDDGLFCTGTDTCTSGMCSSHTGDPCPGADGDGERSACDDGLFCTGTDTCSGGTCSSHTGDPCPGEDGDGDCSESCNEAGDNCTAADTNGSTCDDGFFCNGNDFCGSGTCSTHTGDPCSGPDGDANCSESCNEGADDCSAADVDGSACTDGFFCTGTDTCTGGTCSSHTGDPCPGPDGDGNCSESCNEAADDCTAADTNGSACTDGLFCTGTDTCTGGTCSSHTGDPCPGADGDGNCSESCNEAADDCTAADTNGSACTDGLFCTGTDTCTGGTCSSHTGDPCPGPDGDGNCSESCNEAADDCTAADTNGTACTDGLFCNGTDTCSAGTCSSHAGDPCPGPDGDGNCAESCNETADNCTANDANGSACSDGLFCNGTDTCSSGSCTTHAGDPCPGADGDNNCAETCNEASDNCLANDPDGSACATDSDVCTTDQCSSGTCAHPANTSCKYVTPTGSGTSCTTATPCALTTGLGQVGSGFEVHAGSGTYSVTDEITNIASNTALKGGYNAATWAQTAGCTASVISRDTSNADGTSGTDLRVAAIDLTSKSGFSVECLKIQTSNGTSGTGMSTYGVHMNGASSYVFSNVTITPGAAGSGAAGSSGTNGGTGGSGITGTAGLADGSSARAGGNGGMEPAPGPARAALARRRAPAPTAVFRRLRARAAAVAGAAAAASTVPAATGARAAASTAARTRPTSAPAARAATARPRARSALPAAAARAARPERPARPARRARAPHTGSTVPRPAPAPTAAAPRAAPAAAVAAVKTILASPDLRRLAKTASVRAAAVVVVVAKAAPAAPAAAAAARRTASI
jgi:hypothetical protein